MTGAEPTPEARPSVGDNGNLEGDGVAGPATPATPPKPRTRARRATVAVREASKSQERRAEQLLHLRGRSPAANVLYEAYQRDQAVNGAIFAGAVAFRLFLWMLPLTLAAVAGLGFIKASGNSPEEALHSVGISAISASAVTQALSTSETSRVWAAIVALLFLFPTSNALAKVVHRIHALAWEQPRARLPAPLKAVGAVLVVGIGELVLTGLASQVRALTGLGWVLRFALFAVFSAAWLCVSLLLPHQDARWRALVPGAVLVGLGIVALHLAVVVYAAHKLSSATALYGALGSAVALLTFLYLSARLLVASAVLNATLWERRPGAPAKGGTSI